ncbi:2'-5' RNA ligase family protein [Streptomyces hundungensis]|uniref:HK97 family phage prohead protease n=1 Tax=Streptomyces hundungensis TaxID=1077946 RepID=UPI0033D98FC6
MPSPPPRTLPQRGIARAIFAVTGVVDEVNDLILPGAFARTLAARKVKTVWHHEWKDPVGTVLDIEEWRPGDPRFATIPGGSHWPAAAGALVAVVQFNLRTSRGRDAYEQVKMWHDHGEAQFSIGYKVPPGGASKRHDSVRIIHDLDLYEVSPVLHGAHPLTRSIEVKSDPVTSAPGELEHKATWSSVELKAAEPQAGRGAMVALYLPQDVAEGIAQSEGTSPTDLHITLAYLGDAEALGGHPEDLTDIVTTAVAGTEPLAGSIGGIGAFPDHGDGTPTWVPVDVPGLAELRQRITDRLATSPYSDAVRTEHGFLPHITLGYDLPPVAPVPSTPVQFPEVHVVRGPDRVAIPLTVPAPEPPVEAKSARQVVLEAKSAGGLDKNRGNAEQLRHWYVRGEGAARINWGSPGDFDRCVAIAGEHMAPEDAKGYCNLRHHDALGIYPTTHAAEHKSARAAVLEAKSVPPTPETVTVIQPMPYSYEQLRSRLADAARNLFNSGDGDCFVAVEATYPDRFIVTHHDKNEISTYAIPYTVAGRDIDLGTPQPVELTTVALPVGDTERPVDGDEEVDARYMQPSEEAIEDAAAYVSLSDAKPSAVERLQPAVRKLLAAMSQKGAAVEPNDEEPTDDGSSLDLWDNDYEITDGWDDDPEQPSSGGSAEQSSDDSPDAEQPDPDADVEPGDDSPEEEDDEQVRLDAREVKAMLAALTL